MVQLTNVKAQSDFSTSAQAKSTVASAPVVNVSDSKVLEPLKPKMPSIQQDKTINEAVSKTNSFLAGGSVQFQVDGDKTIVKVVDSETNQIIRQIPSEEAIAISKSLDKLQGLLINSKA